MYKDPPNTHIINTRELRVIQMTPKELKEMIHETVKEALSEFKDEFRREQRKELLTRKKVAELLRISLPTLHQWTKDGKLKAYRKSGRVNYKEEEIIQSMENRIRY